MVSLPYPLVCAVLGFVIGWAPMLFHGPIPEKFDLYFIHEAVAVWAYSLARLSIGFWGGISSRPERWWLRGPLCGFVVIH